MESNLSFLTGTALTIGVLHTLAGPDHYLPFIAMSKARGWSTVKTANVVILCGIGHVLSSIIIGFVGIFAGIAISGISKVESARGDIAAWLLLTFGFLHIVWGLYQLWKSPHYNHGSSQNNRKAMTYWILFTIFIFGPCEPLIPVLIYPAAEHNYLTVFWIAALFAVATISTMLAVVFLLLKGFSLARFNILERYQHVMAGGLIMLCGAGIIFLGL